jgi:hypothetical protein
MPPGPFAVNLGIRAFAGGQPPVAGKGARRPNGPRILGTEVRQRNS